MVRGCVLYFILLCSLVLCTTPWLGTVRRPGDIVMHEKKSAVTYGVLPRCMVEKYMYGSGERDPFLTNPFLTNFDQLCIHWGTNEPIHTSQMPSPNEV